MQHLSNKSMKNFNWFLCACVLSVFIVIICVFCLFTKQIDHKYELQPNIPHEDNQVSGRNLYINKWPRM